MSCVITCHWAFLLFCLRWASHVRDTISRYIERIRGHISAHLELEWFLRHPLLWDHGLWRCIWQIDVHRRCLRFWVHILVKLLLVLLSGCYLLSLLLLMLLIEVSFRLFSSMLCRVVVNKHIFNTSNFLSQKFIFTSQIIVFYRLKLQSFLIIMFHSFNLGFVHTLLLTPCLFHFGLNLFEFRLHLSTALFIFPPEPWVLFTGSCKLRFDLLKRITLFHRLLSKLI